MLGGFHAMAAGDREKAALVPDDLGAMGHKLYQRLQSWW